MITNLLRVMLIAAAATWGLAVTAVTLPRSENTTVDPQPPTIDAQESTVEGYVGSTIKRVYHLPSCSYARLIEHSTRFGTEDEARSAGYKPCTRCLNPNLTVAKPPIAPPP